MTRGEALKDFFRKTILPVASAALLYCIFRSACVKNGELDYLWLWILCGLPFGIWRLRLWIIPGGGSLGGGIALFLLNFVFAGLIGGCVLVWRLLVAAWYVPLHLPLPDTCLLTLRDDPRPEIAQLRKVFADVYANRKKLLGEE